MHSRESMQEMMSFWTQSMNDYWKAYSTAFPFFGGNGGDKNKSSRQSENKEAMFDDLWTTAKPMMSFWEMIMKTLRSSSDAPSFSPFACWNCAGGTDDFSKTFSGYGPFSGIFRSWFEFYEKEIRRYLHMPQIGLTRFYREHCNEATDRYNLFVASAQEFIQILMRPLRDSFLSLQEKLKETENGAVPTDPQKAYNLWIKILEENYLSLLQSAQYTGALSKTLDSLEDFIVARKEVLQDAMKWFHVPAQKEMDELCKEVYQLKKRLKALEKR